MIVEPHRIDAFKCPRCSRPVVPAQPCWRCGKWWEHYGFPTSAAAFEPAGDILAGIVDLFVDVETRFSLLDVGGGTGIAGWHLWMLENPKPVVIVDKFDYAAPPEYADEFIVDDGLNILDRFGPESFDIVLSTETLEHVPKDDGPRFLLGLAEVAKFFVGISTPNGFMKHGFRETSDGRENPHQKHLCGWTLEELMGLGWHCHVNGVQKDGKLSAFQNVAYLSYKDW